MEIDCVHPFIPSVPRFNRFNPSIINQQEHEDEPPAAKKLRTNEDDEKRPNEDGREHQNEDDDEKRPNEDDCEHQGDEQPREFTLEEIDLEEYEKMSIEERHEYDMYACQQRRGTGAWPSHIPGFEELMKEACEAMKESDFSPYSVPLSPSSAEDGFEDHNLLAGLAIEDYNRKTGTVFKVDKVEEMIADMCAGFVRYDLKFICNGAVARSVAFKARLRVYDMSTNEKVVEYCRLDFLRKDANAYGNAFANITLETGARPIYNPQSKSFNLKPEAPVRSFQATSLYLSRALVMLIYLYYNQHKR